MGTLLDKTAQGVLHGLPLTVLGILVPPPLSPTASPSSLRLCQLAAVTLAYSDARTKL